MGDDDSLRWKIDDAGDRFFSAKVVSSSKSVPWLPVSRRYAPLVCDDGAGTRILATKAEDDGSRFRRVSLNTNGASLDSISAPCSRARREFEINYLATAQGICRRCKGGRKEGVVERDGFSYGSRMSEVDDVAKYFDSSSEVEFVWLRKVVPEIHYCLVCSCSVLGRLDGAEGTTGSNSGTNPEEEISFQCLFTAFWGVEEGM